MKSYWKMSPEDQAAWVIEFTKIYQSFSDHDIIGREAAILEHQVPAMFLPPEEDDILTGRFHHPPLVFTPQPASDRGGFAYVANHDKFNELKSSLADPVLVEMVEEAEKFWKDHDTGQQTRLSYPDEVAALLPSDNWTGEPGIGFPLLRMSGSQMNFTPLIQKGIPGLEKEIREYMEKQPESTELYNGMLSALASLRKLILFYEREVRDLLGRARNLEQSINLRRLADALSKLQNAAPKTLFEGMQLVHLYWISSGSNNLGRMDDYLSLLYKHDIESGNISREKALTFFVQLWKLVNYRKIIYDGRVIIGGKGRKHPKEADELALVILDSVGISADVLPQLTLRMHTGMDSRLKERAFDIISRGNPYPMLYNDDVNVPSAARAFGIDEETANDCIPFGCGEYILYGKSFGTPSGVINLAKALEVTLHEGKDTIGGRILGVPEANRMKIRSFDELWKAYTINLEAYIHALAVQEKTEYEVAGNAAPFLYFSILFEDCIKRGKALFDGGLLHLGGTLETYGNTNTADALLAIRKLVFEQKKFTLRELTEALDANFEGYGYIRKLLLDQPKYGNDLDEADDMLIKVHEHACLATKAEAKKVGLDSYLVVNINNSANTIFGKFTTASADGRLAFTSLANGNTPQMGMDKQGATALLNSIAKPATDIHAGASQNFKLSREMLNKYRNQTIALIDTYFAIGGAQLMITAVNKGDLEQAMIHPEEYPNLLVRVGGFSARFVELDRDIQLEILNRTLY